MGSVPVNLQNSRYLRRYLRAVQELGYLDAMILALHDDGRLQCIVLYCTCTTLRGVPAWKARGRKRKKKKKKNRRGLRPRVIISGSSASHESGGNAVSWTRKPWAATKVQSTVLHNTTGPEREVTARTPASSNADAD